MKPKYKVGDEVRFTADITCEVYGWTGEIIEVCPNEKEGTYYYLKIEFDQDVPESCITGKVRKKKAKSE